MPNPVSINFNVKETNCPTIIRLGLFLFGAFCFSPVISFIFIKILGAPLVVSEIPMVFFFFLFRRELGLQVRLSPLVVFCGILLIFSAGLGFFYGAYSKVAILSNARTYIVILFWISCFYGNRKVTFEHMVHLALGSIFGWCLISFKAFSSVVFDSEDGSGAVTGAMLAISLVVSVSYLYKRRKIFWIANILSLGTCFLSGTRRAMLSWLWAFITSIFIEFRIKNLCFAIALICVFSSAIFLSWKPLGEWVKGYSPYMYVRIFHKTEDLITNGTEATNDSGRFERIRNLATIEGLSENLVPRGMVSKWTTREAGTGIFIDCPAYEVYHTFGFLGSFLLFGVVLTRILKHLQLFFRKKQKSSAVFAIMGGHMVIMMFYEGGFITFAPLSIFTAFAIANLFSNREVFYSTRHVQINNPTGQMK